jgi:hypothetical protein
MIFCQMDMDSTCIMRRALGDFSRLSGLVTNLEKNHVFLSSVDDKIRTSLQALLGLRLWSLPIKYF